MNIQCVVLVFVCGMCTVTANNTADTPSLEDFFEYTSFIFHFTDDNNTVSSARYTVHQSGELSRHPKFNHTLKTCVFVHGYHNTQNTLLVKELVNAAVINYKKCNMVTLDWDYFALLDYYKVASRMARKYGEWVGTVLHNCSVSGNGALHPTKLYLIGASLGVHVCGGIGYSIDQLTGTKVSRITGLDPAGPTFQDQDNKPGPDCIKPTDAQSVDIIHGDAGWYGVSYSVGTSDFWPNNGTRPTAGCPYSIAPVDTNESNVCCHELPVKYFIESLKNSEPAYDFVGTKRGMDGIMSKNLMDIVPMGVNCPPTASGNYFLTTNERPPFSRGLYGIAKKSANAKYFII